ncbi:MAG: D-alanyl-D-alanine carboxypeptidase [Microbacteriaceae bacterium]|nr:MAG: D-alanyl-D-alanine carboxypeptidase [Microbacteriaceae bacterium]
MHESDPVAPRRRAADAGPDSSGAATPATPVTRSAASSRHAPFGGVLAAIRRHPRVWLVAAATVGFVLVGGGTVALGALTGASATPVVIASPSASAGPTPAPTPTRPVPTPALAASKLRTCSIASLAQDSRLGTLEAQVLNPTTGEVLFDRNGSAPAATASVMKILTAAAALSVLGPNYQVPTTVVKGSAPGQIVLVGGGDVTLSRTATGDRPFYTGAPHLDALAAQVKSAWDADPANNGQPIKSLVLDASLFGGPVWQPSWDEHEERIVEGSTSYITALQVDGDRNDPYAIESPRSTDPVGRAGAAFASDLGGNIIVSTGTAPAGAKQLGQVLSQPVTALLSQALSVSDNTIMEMLARLVAIKTGAGNTFAAENAGVLKGLAAYGIDTTGITVVDGSGLSGDNRVPPSYLTRLMVKIMNRQDGLGVIYDSLPVSGKSGTLGPGYGRFTGDSAVARGVVNAKTGWINNGYTLAGVVHAQDGTPLTFAVYALGNVRDSAKTAIDALVTGFFRCGNNLSNN